MSNDNKTVIFHTYTQYHKEAIQAEKTGDVKKARELYALAAQKLFEFAQCHSGEYKEARMGEVAQLVAKAKSLNNTAEKISDTAEIKSVETVNEDETIIPDVTFDDVAGLDDVKNAIDRRILKPREHPELYKTLKIKPGGGVLMYGVPGTGKTMIAKAIANKAGAAFFPISCSEIISKWLGESEANVKDLFERARKHEVAIIFFDEFESLGAKRGENTHDAIKRLVAELLNQIDGFKGSFNTLMIIAATNRPWDIDSAFLRPGRFAEMLYVDLPDEEAREYIISKAYEGVPIQKEIDFGKLAKWMEGFNGADVVEFCYRSKMLAADRCIDKYGGDLRGLMITEEDIAQTMECVKSSVRDEDLAKLKDFEEQYSKNIINPKKRNEEQ